MATSNNGLQQWATWSLSPSISAVLITLFISLTLPVLVHWYLYRKAVAKELSTYLLIGPSGSGKTSLASLLATGTASATHTSQAPQTVSCQLPASTKSAQDQYRSEHDTSARTQPTFLLLDTPGHGKLRHHAVSSLATPSHLHGLVFVVDSAAVSSSIGLTEAAEYLYDVLLILQKRHTQSKSSKEPQAIPVLVAANKQDVFSSLPAAIVKAKLEEEIAKIRQTRSKGLLDSGVGTELDSAGDDEQNWLGQYGSTAFKFAQMEEYGVDVRVAGGNVEGDGDEQGKVDEWWTWIGEHL